MSDEVFVSPGDTFPSDGVFCPIPVEPTAEPTSFEDWEDANDLTCQTGGYCIGGYFGFSKQDSLEECRVSCEITSRCNSFSYNHDTEGCMLYDGDCENVKPTGATWTSCKMPANDPSCLCAGEFLGASKQSSEEDCTDKCTTTISCRYTSYNQATDDCLLFADKNPEVCDWSEGDLGQPGCRDGGTCANTPYLGSPGKMNKRGIQGCQEECQALTDCTFYSYKTTTTYCMLWGGTCDELRSDGEKFQFITCDVAVLPDM